MSDLSAKFAALEEQLAAQASATQAYIDTVEPKLQAVFDQLDLMLVNNAANTRYLLAALAQLDPCADCGASLPLPPPIVPGTLPVDTDKCKRIQAFLAAVGSFASAYDTLVSYNVVATVSLLNSTISSILTDLIGGGDLPLPSIPEATNIVGNYFSFASANIFESLSAADGLASVYNELKVAMYAASGTEGMIGAYNAVIDGSGLNFTVKNLLKSTAYNALANYYLDPASSPDLTPYDGLGCAIPMHDITGCTDFSSSPGSDSGHTFDYVVSSPMMGPISIYIGGDFYGWSFQLVDGVAGRGVDIYRTTDGTDGIYTSGHSLGESAQVQSQHSLGICIITHDRDELSFPFTMRVCPPA